MTAKKTTMKCDHRITVSPHQSILIGGVTIGRCDRDVLPGLVKCELHADKEAIRIAMTALARDLAKEAKRSNAPGQGQGRGPLMATKKANQEPLSAKTVDAVNARTVESRNVLDRGIDDAWRVIDDRGISARLEVRMCKACYYLRRRSVIVGHAWTTWYCQVCLQESSWANTWTPFCCVSCSTDRRLCSMCGADLDLHMRSVPNAKRGKGKTRGTS